MLNLGCGNILHPFWENVDFKSDLPDVVSYDLNQGIPYESDFFDAVYHSHLLEHFFKDQAPLFLMECFRVLKPGGVIRVVVPDLETIAKLYLKNLNQALKGNEDAQEKYDWIMLEMFDQMVRNHPGGEVLEYWKQFPLPAENFIYQRAGSEAKHTISFIREKGLTQNKIPQKPIPDPLSLGKFRLSGEIHQWMYDRYSLKKILQECGFKAIKKCKANESRIPYFNNYLLDIESDGSVRKPDSLFMEGIKPLTSKKSI